MPPTTADPLAVARELLEQLQQALSAKDLTALEDLVDDEVALLGTAAANLDRDETCAYLALVVGQDHYLRWDWEAVVPLVERPGLVVFVAVGTVCLEDADGRPVGPCDPFRLTAVAVDRDGRWRLRHLHGSVPQA